MILCGSVDLAKDVRNPNWLPGTVIGTNGEQSYKVKLSDGRIVQRHADHVHSRQVEYNIPVQDDEFDD